MIDKFKQFHHQNLRTCTINHLIAGNEDWGDEGDGEDGEVIFLMPTNHQSPITNDVIFYV
jgi:hypothetical protein